MKGLKLNRQHFEIRLIAVLASSFLTGTGFALEPTSSETQTINYSLERENPPFSSAGLIRFLEDRNELDQTSTPQSTESVATSTLVAEENSSATQSATQSASRSPQETVASPSYSDLAKTPITLAPLVTPNTKTTGIGTNALPQDMVSGRLPQPIPLPTGTTRANLPASATKAWIPGGFCHQPLYWENPMLERHGHQACPHLQPVVSGVRFYGTFLVLPYLATLREPLSDVHTLGSYRPGSSAPALRYRAHYDPRALRNQIIMSGAATAISAP